MDENVSILTPPPASAPASGQPLLGRALLHAVGLSAYFMIVYNGCNYLASRRAHVGTLYYGWEKYIPFVPLAIFPYMSIDLFFFFSPLLCRSIFELRTHSRRIILAISLAALCFVLFPLQMGTGRPVVSGLSGLLFKLLGGFDKPFNLVPSLHIALLCILCVIYSRHTRGILRLLMQMWFVMIAISCLVTNQHHVIDLVGGYILGVLCIYLAPDGRGMRGMDGRMGGPPTVSHETSARPNEITGGPPVPLAAKRVGNARVAWNYAAGSAILALGAKVLYPWGLILLWPAAAGAVVALAYLRVNAGIFRKTAGRLPWSSRIVLAPHLLASAICHHYFKRRCDLYCQIVPGVWIGGRLSGAHARELAAAGVGAVLDVTAEFSETPSLLRMNYLNLPILDLTPPTLEELDAAVAFMQGHREIGVYLHCALGVSRSVCVLAAFLIAAHHARNVDEAFDLILARRPVARLHWRARKVLEEWCLARGGR